MFETIVDGVLLIHPSFVMDIPACGVPNSALEQRIEEDEWPASEAFVGESS